MTMKYFDVPWSFAYNTPINECSIYKTTAFSEREAIENAVYFLKNHLIFFHTPIKTGEFEWSPWSTK